MSDIKYNIDIVSNTRIGVNSYRIEIGGWAFAEGTEQLQIDLPGISRKEYSVNRCQRSDVCKAHSSAPLLCGFLLSWESIEQPSAVTIRIGELLSDVRSVLHEINIPKAKACLYPPGHYYSPCPDLEAVSKYKEDIYSINKEFEAIELREKEQLNLLSRIADEIYPTISFPIKKDKKNRYYYDNPNYSYSDAIVLHSMIRLLAPKRIIEVGSGFSSAVMLDTNDHYFNQEIDLTFIEPYPDLLVSISTVNDSIHNRLIPKQLQEVDTSIFEALNAGDFLFIDSTHVSKINSDVNKLFFEILPRLTKGVYIHFHDIFYPFEYPWEWVCEGRAWNEAYFLRSFLMYNEHFQIIYFQDMLFKKHQDYFKRKMPLCLKNSGGNIWLRKNL